MYSPSNYKLISQDGVCVFVSDNSTDCETEMHQRINTARHMGVQVDENFFIEHVPGDWIDPE